ncbi:MULTISPECIES: NAD/NADP octopine/nopaline dehydrogenase family protein [unclassified Microbacterium]|uniref:NAD/NADP octopine/nopaline dehydrogenase family protein n=1 Tax=unclassified Microbacterium TaxID=2609290 RepID=UPI0030105255
MATTDSTTDRLAVVGERPAIGVAAWAAAHSGGSVLLSLDDAPPAGVANPGGPAKAATPFRDDALVDVCTTEHPRATHWVLVCRSARIESALDAHGAAMSRGTLLLAPGGFGGVLRAHAWFQAAGIDPPTIAEATGFPAMGSGDDLDVRAVKRHLPIAGRTLDETLTVADALAPWLPDLEPSTLATTSFSNTNHLIHPPLVLSNAVRIDRDEPFGFYREGLSEAAEELLSAADAERRALVAALGGDDRSGVDWMNGFYGDQGMSGDTLVECLRSFPPFDDTPAPRLLEYRYLTDDVPFGVAAWAQTARRIGTPHRTLSALHALSSAILGRELDPPPGLVDDVVDHILSTRKETHHDALA